MGSSLAGETGQSVYSCLSAREQRTLPIAIVSGRPPVGFQLRLKAFLKTEAKIGIMTIC